MGIRRLDRDLIDLESLSFEVWQDFRKVEGERSPLASNLRGVKTYFGAVSLHLCSSVDILGSKVRRQEDALALVDLKARGELDFD